jgi:hypothetical protein
MDFFTAAREACPVCRAGGNRKVRNDIFCHGVAVLVVKLDLL